jgi:peptidylprolyl isomerase|tara:strand:+ start:1643 stop:2215 length:573 start_codon:yes stop_codon:yes gene_type:complete
MKVVDGHNVSVHYKGTLVDGTEFDNSRARGQALEFEVGSGKMIPGFNDAVIGMTEGEVRTVTLPPEQGYGAARPDAFRPAPKSAFGADFEFVIGEVVQGNSPDGQFLAKIHEIQEDTVVLDLNHPLAGEQLTFEIQLMEIKDAGTQDEVTMANWNAKMKKAELLDVAKSRGLPVNTKSTKAQIIQALQAQ